MTMTRKHILIPVAIFIAFAALYVILSLANGSDILFRPVWDIGHYQSIAERGYEVYPCDPAVHWPLGEICGNVGWFPAEMPANTARVNAKIQNRRTIEVSPTSMQNSVLSNLSFWKP